MSANHVTIIIPVYKVEKYVAKCIQSIIDQSFHNFNLLLIDDCGGDNSISICENLLQRSDIPYEIIYNEVNKGVSESRNIGIRRSTTKYVMFIDSDDWIANDMVIKLYEAAELFNADVVGCRIVQYSESAGTFVEMPNIRKGCYTSDEYLKHFFRNETNLEVCTKLVKRKIFDEIRFPKDVIFEDILTIPYIIQKANKVVQLDEGMYFYVKRNTNTSITGSRPTNIPGFILGLENLKDDFGSSPTLLSSLSMRFIYRNLLVFTYILIFYSRKYSEVKLELKLLGNCFKLNEIIKLYPSIQLLHLALFRTSKYLFYKSYSVAILRRGLI